MAKLKTLLQTPPMRDREPSLQPYQNLTHEEMFFEYFRDNLCPDIRPCNCIGAHSSAPCCSITRQHTATHRNTRHERPFSRYTLQHTATEPALNSSQNLVNDCILMSICRYLSSIHAGLRAHDTALLKFSLHTRSGKKKFRMNSADD